jgi:hypothetical protein
VHRDVPPPPPRPPRCAPPARGSRIRPAAAASCGDLSTGQPMLMSIRKAPAASARRAASAMAAGRWSNSCTPIGPGFVGQLLHLDRCRGPAPGWWRCTISVNSSASGARAPHQAAEDAIAHPARGDCSTRQRGRRGPPVARPGAAGLARAGLGAGGRWSWTAILGSRPPPVDRPSPTTTSLP